MSRPALVGVLFWTSLLGASLAGQAPAKVDFGRDVQPILKEYCVGCHGPSQQLNNFRLDRRREALRGGTFPVIAPGNSDGSRLYQRLIGNRFGLQMPPTAPLPAEAIATLKAWIDQGVAWPDEFAGDVPPPVADPNATRLMAALRDGDHATFTKVLSANPKAANLTGTGGSTPLLYAAFYGNRSEVQALLDRGADPNLANQAGSTPLMWAVSSLDKTQALLAAGAWVDARSDDGRTPMLIASGLMDGGPVVQRLLDYGASPEARLATDLAPLREAARVGDPAMFRALLTYGANPKGPGTPTAAFIRTNCAKCADILDLGPAPPPAASAPQAPTASAAPSAPAFSYNTVPSTPPSRPVTMNADSIRAAIDRSLPLLQKADVAFIQKTGCVSCHHNSLVAMAVATARQHGFRVDEKIAASQAKAAGVYIESWRDRSVQGLGIAGGQDSVSYILFGLLSEHYPSDGGTDAQAFFLKIRQSPDGRWRIAARRPPIESNDIQVTAVSMRSLQIYAPKARQAEFQQTIDRARDWLVTAKPESTEERVFRLLGLFWAKGPQATIDEAARELIADQRPDGGWSQTPTLTSDAYATGQAIVALRESGALKPDDPVYARAAQLLLNTQYEDGSWYVKNRANPVQAPFESGFPHGRDQWISAAATGWATTALALSR
jgi:hypothetical protein